MPGIQITDLGPKFSYMRSQCVYEGNNKNSGFEFQLHHNLLFMLFNRSNTNIREFIVIYVLNFTTK